MFTKGRKYEVKKSALSRLLMAVLASAVSLSILSLTAVGLVGCTSLPTPKQVSTSATDKPINTPEAAQAIVQRYGR